MATRLALGERKKRVSLEITTPPGSPGHHPRLPGSPKQAVSESGLNAQAGRSAIGEMQ